MLTLLLGVDWTENTDAIFKMIARDVSEQRHGRVLMVPELISHDTERKLCAYAGDTSSRFAEVLTFTRLAQRVSDFAHCGTPECLDKGGRLVAMAAATRQLHSKLKAYGAVETRPEFLVGLIDAVDEFKRCCISPEDLAVAAKKADGSFAQKLEELALILEAYDSLCARGKRDPRDQMNWLLEQLEDCNYAENHVFYIDGFPDFTRQHTAILEHLIKNSPQVTVSLTCDCADSDLPAFEKAASTASELLRLADRAGIKTEIIHIQSRKRAISPVLSSLFQGKIEQALPMLKAYRCESVNDACHSVAEQISDLVQKGCLYRDISVVCTDMAAYSDMLNMILSRYRIPAYQSGTENILEKTVISTVLTAIDTVVGGFERGDVLRYMKSALSSLSVSECDMLENYAIIWNITGNRWTVEWENHPEGLGVKWTDKDRALLHKINQIRCASIMPLVHLDKAMKDANSLSQLVSGVYDFLEEVQFDKQLERLAGEMEKTGDLRGAQILNQLWEILLLALEQLSDILGDTYWDKQNFTKLLKLLLGQYDVGTIPAVLDAVMVGSVSAMRCQMPKHLFILGANEGSFPAYSGSTGVLTDQERNALRRMGVPLTGGAIEGLQAEFSEIYSVFCGAENSVSVFCDDGQPSFLYRRLREMAGEEICAKPMKIAPVPDEVGAYLLRNQCTENATDLGIEEACKQLQSVNDYSLGEMSAQTVKKLYNTNIKLSASQIDKLADCRMAYFLKYGLKLKERKEATVDPAEFGTYVHAVLEDTAREIMNQGGFHKVSLEKTIEIANQFSENYIAERFSQIDSQRVQYLFRRNVQELEIVVTELWNELKDSEFEPAEFEMAFDAIPITGKMMTAFLRGYVDRVDACKINGQVYYRVVDYKTGKKDFDYCDVYNGLGLQMLLYLFALEERETDFLGEHPVPAGVQYFPARVPILSVDGKMDEEATDEAREKLWKRKGLLLADEEVLQAMEPSEKPKRLSYTIKKDGTLSGDLADRKQLKLLKAYIFALLGKMVDDIASGNVEPNPYTRGGRHNACAFCPYGAVCHQETVEGRRDYAAMTAEKFWEEVEKEASDLGRNTNV